MAFGDTIDITHSDDSYDRLVAHINDKVQAMIKFDPKAPLPHRLIMTKKQKKMLRRYKMMKPMMGTVERLWLTPYNAMEVQVV